MVKCIGDPILEKTCELGYTTKQSFTKGLFSYYFNPMITASSFERVNDQELIFQLFSNLEVNVKLKKPCLVTLTKTEDGEITLTVDGREFTCSLIERQSPDELYEAFISIVDWDQPIMFHDTNKITTSSISFIAEDACYPDEFIHWIFDNGYGWFGIIVATKLKDCNPLWDQLTSNYLRSLQKRYREMMVWKQQNNA